MKISALIFLIPSLAWSAAVPLNSFEQAKLETLLRNIPGSIVKTENKGGFVRKFHQFPKSKKASFTISCYADYYGSAPIPSEKNCAVEVSNKAYTGDEFIIQFADTSTVNTLRKAIPYGSDLKKFISHERVWGQGNDGINRNLFRYSFICTAKTCDISFSTKPAL